MLLGTQLSGSLIALCSSLNLPDKYQKVDRGNPRPNLCLVFNRFSIWGLRWFLSMKLILGNGWNSTAASVYTVLLCLWCIGRKPYVISFNKYRDSLLSLINTLILFAKYDVKIQSIWRMLHCQSGIVKRNGVCIWCMWYNMDTLSST